MGAEDPVESRRAAVLTGWGLEQADYLPSAQVIAQTLVENGWAVDAVEVQSAADLGSLGARLSGVDFTYICHGEDVPTVQLMQEAGLRSTAPAPWTSVTASYDKHLSYQIASAAGVPSPTGVVRRSVAMGDVPAGMRYPLVVKPVRAGSSHGVRRVSNAAELEEALRDAGKIDQSLIVEEFLAGSEYTVGAIGGTVLGALRISGYRPGIYDYHVKHEALADFAAVDPADPVFQHLSQYTAKLAQAFSVTGFWRTDYRANGATIRLLDINLLPFLARFDGGMMAALLGAADLSFYDFLDLLNRVS